MPPFKVRDSEKIAQKIGQDSALPHGFIAVPLFNVEATNISNIKHSGCERIEKHWNSIRLDQASYTEYADLVRSLKVQVGAAL